MYKQTSKSPLRRAGLAALALAIATWAASAAAEDGLPVGWLDANAPGELTPAVPILLRPAGHDAAYERISRLFADELGKRGYEVAKGGRVNALSYRFIVELAETRREGFPHVRLRAALHGGEADGAVELMQKVDDGQNRATRLQSSPRTLLVEVLDADRRLLWSARATASVQAESLEAVAAIVVPPLLDRLGRDASGENIYFRY